MDTDRLDDGRRMYHIGQRYAERFGATWLLPVHHLGEALAAFHAGQYDDALAALSTGEQVVAEVGTMTLAVWACSLGAHIAIDRDDLATATDRLAAAEQHLRDAGPGLGYDWLLWGQARLLEASGDIAGAAHALSAAWEMAAMLGLISQRRLIGPDLVSLLMAGGERDQARRIALALAEAAELSGGVPSLKATALRCQGVVDGDPVVIERAVAIAAACPQRVQYARTCEDAGHVMIKTGEEDRARELFTTAADVYHQATATRGERRVDAKLRELGVARGRRERRSRPTTGWDALTPTELKVSRMAAEGLTNPEIGRRLFISPRTVETHLSHVYAKLGMTSRVELAMVVAQRSQ
jgi:DNA-binding CsgD family transcriptional regulator